MNTHKPTTIPKKRSITNTTKNDLYSPCLMPHTKAVCSYAPGVWSTLLIAISPHVYASLNVFFSSTCFSVLWLWYQSPTEFSTRVFFFPSRFVVAIHQFFPPTGIEAKGSWGDCICVHACMCVYIHSFVHIHNSST